MRSTSETGDGFCDVLTDLVLASHELHPDAIPALVAGATRRLGARDAALLLVDLGQRTLSPLGGPSVHPPQAVDGTAAGQAYRSEAPVAVPVEGGGHRLWVPLMDSAERVGVLGVSVDRLDDDDLRRWQALASYLGQLVVAKAPYGDSITLARRTAPTSLAAELRWAMLPPLTFSSAAVAVSGILEPAYEIAGDTFDYAVNGSTLHLAILDAMGHGLEASRMANLAVASYRHSRRHGLEPAATVAAMDSTVEEQFGPSKFVTGQIATLDTGTGRFRLLNLGHPLPLLLREGTVAGEVEARPGSPIGLGQVPSAIVEVPLEPGDAVLLHTDGITSARDQSGEEFGDERLSALVGRLMAAGAQPPELLRNVVEAVLAFQAYRPRDDATLLHVTWRAG